MTKQTRRDFIKKSAGAAGAGLALPVLNRTAMGTTIVKQLADVAQGDGKVLVILELAGGNDMLNTIVPLKQYTSYASLRPLIAIPQGNVLPLYGAATSNGQPTMGLAPYFQSLMPVFDAGKVAVIQSAHYPNPNLSHDFSRRIYYTGIPTNNIALQGTGWIGRHSKLYGSDVNSLDTIGIGGVNKTLYASGAKASGINADVNGNPSGYSFSTTSGGDANNQLTAAQVMDPGVSPIPYQELWETTTTDAITGSASVASAASSYQPAPGVNYPSGNSFFYGLRLIAKLACSTTPNLGTRVFYISQGGYDTHAGETTDHPVLLGRVSEGLKAFYDDLAGHGLGDKVIILIWSEFGRRAAGNASNGTDHGTATDMFVIGGAVKGGVYGADPDLLNLTGGNLRWSVDFRSVYTEIIAKWLGGDPAEVLGGSFPQLGFL
jgi:uncharacterized protein (DUF1501 family)